MNAQPRALKILDIVSVILLAIATYLVFGYAPMELVMGNVQRIFYFHVANAWVGMLGFIVAAVAGIAYLRSKDLKWDVVEMAAVEISLVFFSITIVSGSIWAYPAWNTWWTWDPRLTTAAILELIYLAYLLLRQGLEDPDQRARFGAVYTLIGSISVPITFLSIRFLRTIHPAVILGSNANAQGSFDMTPKMLTTFLFSLLTFSLLFVVLLWHRIRLGHFQDKIEELKLKFMQ